MLKMLKMFRILLILLFPISLFSQMDIGYTLENYSGKEEVVHDMDRYGSKVELGFNTRYSRISAGFNFTHSLPYINGELNYPLRKSIQVFTFLEAGGCESIYLYGAGGVKLILPKLPWGIKKIQNSIDLGYGTGTLETNFIIKANIRYKF